MSAKGRLMSRNRRSEAMSKTTFPQALHDFGKTNGENTATRTVGPSLTRQEFLAECDINTLMKQYDSHVHGGPGGLSASVPMYFDFAEAPQTLLEFMSFMQGAERAFM